MTILDEPPAAGVQPAATSPAEGVCRVPLLDGTAEVRYRRRGRWAVTRGMVCTGADGGELALSEYLDVLRERRLRPLFAGVPDPSPFARRGLYTRVYGWRAVLPLADYHLAAAAGPRLRRDVEVADREGVTVLPYRPEHEPQLAEFAPGVEVAGRDAEAWVATGATGAVLAIAVWQPAPALRGDHAVPGAGPAGRALRLAAVRPQAPPSVVEVLLAAIVDKYRRRGVPALYLGWRSAARWLPVPDVVADGGTAAVLSRFDPRWEQRWLAIPSGWQLPAAAWALR